MCVCVCVHMRVLQARTCADVSACVCAYVCCAAELLASERQAGYWKFVLVLSLCCFDNIDNWLEINTALLLDSATPSLPALPSLHALLP